jgi:ATP-dependent Lhr-like helicase
VIGMLSDGIATSRGRSGAFLHRDQVNRISARPAWRASGRHHVRRRDPRQRNFAVTAEPDGRNVGTVDEDFAPRAWPATSSCWARNPGASSAWPPAASGWRTHAAHAAHGPVLAGRSAPAAPRNYRAALPAPAPEFELPPAVWPSRSSSKNAVWTKPAPGRPSPMYAAGVNALGAVPSFTTVVAERFFDEAAACSWSSTRPSARASIAPGVWRCASASAAPSISNCRPPPPTTASHLSQRAARRSRSNWCSNSSNHKTLEHVLTQALLAAPMFTARWRWNASRALAILRFTGGNKVPAPIQRMRSDDLLASVFPDQVACGENLDRRDSRSRSPPRQRDHRQLPA